MELDTSNSMDRIMRRLFLSLCHTTIALPRGAAPIGIGLAMLIAAMLWPGSPAVSAMAMVTLGATDVTLARFRRSATMLPILVFHAAVYGGLYAIFVCATLDASASRVGTVHQLDDIVGVDLALSIVPIGMAAERAWRALNCGRLTE
jgi:hypothetical protein